MKYAGAGVAFLLAALLMLSSSSAVAQQPAAAKTLAVVDMVKVFGGLNEASNGNADIEKLGTELERQRQAMIKDLEEMKKRLNELNPESPEGKELLEKAMQKGLELQNFGDYMREKLQMEQRIRTAALYKKINDAVKAYADSHGILLVLAMDKDDMLSAQNVQELQSRITVRKVIYANDSLDITRDIIESMNAATHLSVTPGH